MGHERANSYWETVELGQLRWAGECVNASFPFVILYATIFGIKWGEGQEPSQ